MVVKKRSMVPSPLERYARILAIGFNRSKTLRSPGRHDQEDDPRPEIPGYYSPNFLGAQSQRPMTQPLNRVWDVFVCRLPRLAKSNFWRMNRVYPEGSRLAFVSRALDFGPALARPLLPALCGQITSRRLTQEFRPFRCLRTHDRPCLRSATESSPSLAM
jgi:hypothetical protein